MLTRREVMALFARGAAGAAPHRGEMLWDYFMTQLDAADQRRRRRLQALGGAADLEALRTRVRRSLLQAIGDFPERTPLNARVVGTLARADYVIEKIIFESRPRYYVTANLYRPKAAAGPRPGVIESCGHYLEGKAAPDYQRACAGLAKKGFLALIFDPMGQGERLMYGPAKGASATREHAIAGNPCFLAGRTLAHYRIWDAMRALDYLETRPEVDKTRLGMFGHSGGGMMTLLTAPLEPRLRAVMSCCAVTSFYHKTKALLIADPEQIVPGVYREGVDHPELIAAVAPRAFLIGAALKDYVPLDGTRRTYEEARRFFGDRLGLVETNDEHKLNQELREACYGWMLKHLAGETGDAREPAIEVESTQTLRCTPSGCVMDLPGARGIYDLNRDYARQLGRGRKGAVSLPLPRKLEREPGIELPSALTPAGSRRGVLLILISPQRNPAFAKELAQSGCAVMELDLRGWGETTPRMPEKKARFSWEGFFAYRSFELGRPLLGMRVLDLLATVREHQKAFVIGLDAGGLVALHAAAVSQAIAGVAAVRTLASYESVMEQRVSAEPVANFVPGALAHYDIPQLIEHIRPRPCVLAAQPDARAILQGLNLL